ncbi:MAG: hypothetical protein H6667_10345 [Ardenticatenaceae bacterium]|nr:hypothetical protein [Ardenticatenaceae bacterium]MCB9446412.1 hypothetical protein [Ardenticatenaceae bacterium]
MLTMRDVLVEELRREEKLRWAEYGRFVRHAVNDSPWHMTIGAAIGRLLVKWGHRLQARCAARCTQPMAWKKVYYQW